MGADPVRLLRSRDQVRRRYTGPACGEETEQQRKVRQQLADERYQQQAREFNLKLQGLKTELDMLDDKNTLPGEKPDTALTKGSQGYEKFFDKNISETEKANLDTQPESSVDIYDQMIAHDYKYGTVYVGSYNSEPVGLPNRAAKGEIDIEEIDKAVEEFKLEDLSDREQRVVERYIELPQLLEVLKPGQVVSTRDENGYPWLSIPIEKDDATAPIRLFQEMRGYIDISERSDFFKITLTGEANLSTFLHESGHMFLEIMRNLALDPNSKDEIKQMYATVERWLGVEPGQELTRDQHEQWARGFELYLRSGKAPSIEPIEMYRVRATERINAIRASKKA